MVKCYGGAPLDRTFAALSDPTRRAILARLASGAASVMELAAPCDMSVPAVTKHLRVLAAAGLITTRKTGRVRHCQLDPAPLRSAADWLQFYRQFWTEQLDHLGAFLEHVASKEQPWPTKSRQTRRPSASRARTASRKRSSSKR
jgi:DNA-binding transcriptional ArsR family regulator